MSFVLMAKKSTVLLRLDPPPPRRLWWTSSMRTARTTRLPYQVQRREPELNLILSSYGERYPTVSRISYCIGNPVILFEPHKKTCYSWLSTNISCLPLQKSPRLLSVCRVAIAKIKTGVFPADSPNSSKERALVYRHNWRVNPNWDRQNVEVRALIHLRGAINS